MDVTKLQFLGSVDYAQHNFARLKPLLYSTDGRLWEGEAERDWFPNTGLVFSVAPELRYSPAGSLWTFRAQRNTREDAADKDLFVAIQAKAANEFLTTLSPMGPEALRVRAVDEGFPALGVHKVGLLLPEELDRWVLVADLEHGEDGRYRAMVNRALNHVKVFEGDPASLVGLPTPDGRWVLPPVARASGEARNWQPLSAFMEDFTADLRRWLPHGPHRAQAQTAAQALRELLPLLRTLPAAHSVDARAALARATEIVDSAEATALLVEELVKATTDSKEYREEIEARRRETMSFVKTEALAGIEQVEATARSELAEERAGLEVEIAEMATKLAETRRQVEALEAEAQAITQDQDGEINKFAKAVDKIVNRARREPAAVVAEWLAADGARDLSRDAEEDGSTPPVWVWPDAPRLSTDDLGAALFKAAPARNEGQPRLMILDAAIRARELPVLVGSLAREYAEAWVELAAAGRPYVVGPDPTLLSMADLTPAGARAHRAPLAQAFAAARGDPGRLLVVLLDDLDPPSAAFWLPQLARAYRQPDRHGFPPNLVFLAVLEARASDMALTPPRARELFPMDFADCQVHERTRDARFIPTFLDPHALVAPNQRADWPGRVAALETAAAMTLSAEDARWLAASFANHLTSAVVADAAQVPMPLATLLARASQLLTALQGA